MLYTEKIIKSGNYLEVCVIPHNIGLKVKDIKKEERQIIIEKQKVLNDKNAIKKLHQVVLTNFNRQDYHLSLTYKEAFMPVDEAEAKKTLVNFFRRVKAKVKKLGRKKVKYIAITEKKNKKGEECRLHHHIIINNSLSRDELEECWTTGRGKNKILIGFSNADKLQFNKKGLIQLVKYITKNTGGEKWIKRWISSNNLQRPTILKKGRIYVNLDMINVNNKLYWEKKYKGYEFVEGTIKLNEVVKKPYLYIELIKKDCLLS